jgi:hypothetical protein
VPPACAFGRLGNISMPSPLRMGGRGRRAACQLHEPVRSLAPLRLTVARHAAVVRTCAAGRGLPIRKRNNDDEGSAAVQGSSDQGITRAGCAIVAAVEQSSW